jgi:predicted aspartyl protease
VKKKILRTVVITGDVLSTLADGRITGGKRTMIDTLIVGPRRATNLSITGSKVSGSMNKGLLGMNFLKENPFHIDFDKKMIIWM